MLWDNIDTSELVIWGFKNLRICAFANNQYAIEHALGDFRCRFLWCNWGG